MMPKGCEHLADVEATMPRSASTSRGRSAVTAVNLGANRVIEMCEKHGAPKPGRDETPSSNRRGPSHG
jgi:hypothetical protein